MPDQQQEEVMTTLAEVLEAIREQRLILLPDGELTPKGRATQGLLQAVQEHREELNGLLEQADIRVCSVHRRDLHRKYYYYKGEGRFACGICERYTSTYAQKRGAA